ncbi:MAG: endopeptidase La [Bacilli bacterium]|nr:endopeptidase La [Mollicutes bacterium]MDY3898754.1 endopeptidase La [Bacilli bacterium]
MFELNEQVTEQLPAIVVSDIVPLPNNEIRVEINRPEDIKALKSAEQYRNYIFLMLPSKNDTQNEVIDNYYKRGVVAKIVLNMTNPNGSRRVKLQTIVRADVEEFVLTSPHLLVKFTTQPSISSDSDKEIATLELIKQELVSNNKMMPVLENKDAILNSLRKGISSAEFSDVIAINIIGDFKSHLKYLFELDITKRLLMILEDLRKQKYFASLESKIDEEVKRSINEAQKEYYLREKMKAIQDELGDKAKKETDIDALRKKIKEAKMPKTVEEKAYNELNRYMSTPSTSPESGIIRTYLDFLIALPWNTQSVDSDDIKKAKKILDEDHYGLDKVKERILEYLAVKIMTQKNPQAILCLVGPPGVGKTSLAKSIARALNKKFVKLSLGGVKDESEIRGHRRTYLGALPGRILQNLKRAGTNNPVFLLDEIDKMSSDYKGDPTSAMLEVLDGEQNQFFSDNYLEEPFDLSHVFFIATANYLGNIPEPLRDRIEIVEVSSYTEYEKFEIATHHLLKKQLLANGLDESQFSISDQAIYSIIQNYTREAGVRELERLLSSIIRKAIKNILLNGASKIEITVDNLEEYLGKPKFTNNKTEENDLVGIVTGLAYTQFGGDTLSIEATHYKGEGKLLLTGQLGDVMKESAQAAFSYVKSNVEKFNINIKDIKESDVHIHVPEGAIPKDGPSAGVTITTALISTFTNRPVHHEIGMTGEVTLRGQVLPIGGLREKSIAAHRSGLKKIIIPYDNLKDIDEIPESVKNSLEIIPVKSVEEIVDIVLK